jgi:pyridoxal phosphate enzyme (YggS family)
MAEMIPTVDEIKSRWQGIQSNVLKAAMSAGRDPNEISVIAVSKIQPAEVINVALQAGITLFGENYAQELRDKQEIIDKISTAKPRWHFIGHLQTNKVKYLVPYIECIHSVDSINLAEEISRQAEKYSRTIDIMLQVNTSGEESKSGCEPEEAESLASGLLKIGNIKLIGMMTIGSFSSDESLVRREFTMLMEIRDIIQNKFGLEQPFHLSMGMSGDYEIAISEGATYVRIGTAIFGARQYTR